MLASIRYTKGVKIELTLILWGVSFHHDDKKSIYGTFSPEEVSALNEEINALRNIIDELVKDGHESRSEEIGCILPLRGDEEFLNLILIFFEN